MNYENLRIELSLVSGRIAKKNNQNFPSTYIQIKEEGLSSLKCNFCLGQPYRALLPLDRIELV